MTRLKGLPAKIDKAALMKAIGLMLMSWAALPIIYYLLVRKKKPMEEVMKDEEMAGAGDVMEDV